MEENQINLAETIVREARKPFILDSDNIAVPTGYTLHDTEKFMEIPRRKIAKVSLTDLESFIGYIKCHGSLKFCTVYCAADYTAGQVSFKSIINDHGGEPLSREWRDHIANYTPQFSEEWKRWSVKNTHPFGQVDFATFIEENLKDIASVPNSPTGAQMLEMALAFEANQDMRFKSAVRLQNGGVNMGFVQDDDAQTLATMKVFERFSIGIPVFWNGDPYQIDARLRYRVHEGKLTFWYELIRKDKVLEDGTKSMIELIKKEAGFPFYFGNPGV